MTLNIRLFCISICICISAICFGQGNAVGLHVSTTEYVGELNNNNFGDLYQFKFFAPGAGISLQQRLNASFNLVESAFYDKVQYKTPDKTLGVDADFFTLNLKLKYKFNNGYLLGEKAFFAPFLTLGAGGTYISSINSGTFQAPFAVNEFRTDFAAGAGAVIRFSEKFYLEYAATFHQPVYDGWDGVTKGYRGMYLQHCLGLIFTLNQHEKKDSDGDGVKDSRDNCPETPAGTKVDFWGCPVGVKSNDDDSDGVRNRYDECPNTPRGTPVNDRGCPVTPPVVRSNDDDGDGVKNRYDECPNTPPGTKVDEKGCPEKVYTNDYSTTTTAPPIDGDDDGDGVPNSRDMCPRTPRGQAVNYYGCPAADNGDNDGDGVPNSIDKCPYTYGSSNNYGCPEVREESKKRLDFATHGIYFETGKATIKPLSYAVLNDIVTILQEYKDYHVRLAGHTDAIGSDANNFQLSDARVISVKNYFVSKGVDAYRFETRGFGETRPVASNATVEGRAENRRVEIQLFLK
jgi:outer membrane protein OmpA-like peptidoglycan-associated protein